MELMICSARLVPRVLLTVKWAARARKRQHARHVSEEEHTGRLNLAGPVLF